MDKAQEDLNMGSTKRKARVILTEKCGRKCHYCVNHMKWVKELMKPITAEGLVEFPKVIITGGEPMLVPDDLEHLCWKLKSNNPKVKIYLYTALYRHQLSNLLNYDLVDGVHYTLHTGTTMDDVRLFYRFQQFLRSMGQQIREKSFRLYINNEVMYPVEVYPPLWARVEVKPFLKESECQLPEGEELFYLVK
jgi:hypothetical protein